MPMVGVRPGTREIVPETFAPPKSKGGSLSGKVALMAKSELAN